MHTASLKRHLIYLNRIYLDLIDLIDLYLHPPPPLPDALSTLASTPSAH
jgi:hypothetical protein